MQKTIRILAIIAAALVATSLFLLLVSLPLQQTLAAKLLSPSGDVLAYMPIIPWATITGCVWLLGLGGLAVVFGGNRRGGIWLEIVVFLMVALALPAATTLASYLQNIFAGQFRGSAYLAAQATANTIANWCMWPGNLGRCLIAAVCGMSIVYKHMSKKLADAGKA